MHLCTGPFKIHLVCDHPPTLAQLRRLYRHHAPAPAAQLTDFTIELRRPLGVRRWWRPQIQLHTDSVTPFEPFPLDHALPLFEWGLNWCIATQAHQFLMLHSAVVEKDGYALIMPALPGSGKSTLCSALMLRGWRLISDEFGLVRPLDPRLRLHPLPRPVPLKNRSIDVIRDFSDTAEMGPVFPRTRKGDVAHLMPSRDSQQRGNEPALPGWLLFPRYGDQAAQSFEALSPGWAFLKLSANSFNYQLQGARGFNAAGELADRCPAYALEYSDLDHAIELINQRHREIVRQSSATPDAR